MKNGFFGLALACLMGIGIGAPAVAHAGCANGGRFQGGYSLLVAGNSLTTSKGGKYLSGALNFDGKCGFTGANISGGVNGLVSTVSVVGTYNAKPDGTIALTMTPSDGSVVQTYVVGYSVTMNKAVGIEMDGSATATIDLQAQLNVPPGGYTDASLSGTFATTCSGLAASKNDVNYFTYDGAGELHGANPYDRNGSIGIAHVTGQYFVRADGTFQGSLNGNFSQYSFTGVISNNLNEIQYTYTQTNLGGIVACTGWH